MQRFTRVSRMALSTNSAGSSQVNFDVNHYRMIGTRRTTRATDDPASRMAWIHCMGGTLHPPFDSKKTGRL